MRVSRGLRTATAPVQGVERGLGWPWPARSLSEWYHQHASKDAPNQLVPPPVRRLPLGARGPQRTAGTPEVETLSGSVPLPAKSCNKLGRAQPPSAETPQRPDVTHNSLLFPTSSPLIPNDHGTTAETTLDTILNRKGGTMNRTVIVFSR